jgi:hypothetical protein
MDFGRTLALVAGFLEPRGIPYAVIGGVALAAYGSGRMTLDLDFITEARIQDELVRFLESQGFESLHRSSGFSNHLHPDPLWGRVDVLYVRDETATKLFSACRPTVGPGGRAIPVPRPEHLAALKVHALKANPERRLQDLADVRFLAHLPGVDRKEIRSYFERENLERDFDENI